MKPIFIDCGYHQGQALAHFKRLLSLDEDWDVFAFECNPACHGYFPDFCPHGWHYSPKAVWIADTALLMRQEDWQKSGSGSPIVDRANIMDGWGSTVMAANQHKALSLPEAW